MSAHSDDDFGFGFGLWYKKRLKQLLRITQYPQYLEWISIIFETEELASSDGAFGFWIKVLFDPPPPKKKREGCLKLIFP